ncbi:hypothetical protein K5D36_24760 [Pseudomonas cichorii]|nr:hypothetical protein [Pseudomonas cichorii]
MSNINKVKVEQWMVAETLAEHLLPLLERYDVKNRGHGAIYVDHEQYNIHTEKMILADLSTSLGVSAQLIRSRLIEVGLLNDARSTLPVRNEALYIIDRPVYWDEDEQEENISEIDEEYYKD